MNRNVQTLMMLFLLPLMAVAQPKGKKKDQMDAIRKNVYSRTLILSDDEAAKFWPVFDKMEAEMEAVRQQMKTERKKVQDNYATLSDADLDKSIKATMDLEQKTLDIRRKYYEEFKKVLPMKKVALIPKAEREFKRELLNRVKGEGPPGGPPPPGMRDDE